MTLVEFFDQMPIENVVSCLANRPDKLVLVGDKKRMERNHQNLMRFLDTVGVRVEVEYRNVIGTSLSHIVSVLKEIVEENENCCFDLSGGDDLSLVAVGIVYQQYRDRGIQLHRYNLRTGAVYDCDLDGQVVSGELPSLTVEENILLHGGRVVMEKEKENGTVRWDLDPEFQCDIDQMWEICKANCGLWNLQTTVLGELESIASMSDEGLAMQVNILHALDHFDQKGINLNLKGIYYALEDAGLIYDLSNDGEYFSLRYKNQQVKKCLIKAGTVLELKTYLLAREAKKPDGTPVYTDAMTGVFIDWDGVVHDKDSWEVDTENEIDVILMKGLIPVFISCKNGAVGEDELYKLNTVASRFGGSYVRKVLIATTLGKGGESKRYFLERAKNMNITVIEGVHKLPEEAFQKKLRNLAG